MPPSPEPPADGTGEGAGRAPGSGAVAIGSGIVGRSDGTGALVVEGAISEVPATSAAATSSAGLLTGCGRGIGFVFRLVLTIALTRVGPVVRSISET